MEESPRRVVLYGGVLPALTTGAVYGVAPGYLIALPLVGVVFSAVAAGARPMANVGDVFRYSVGLLVWSVLVLVFFPVFQ
jgi:hypothetical protein